MPKATTECPQQEVIKYPRTAHLFDAGGTATTNDDLVFPDFASALETFCNGNTIVTIEEKVDGANLGVSIDQHTQEVLIQNRSHYVSGRGGNHAQFNRLCEWTALHKEALCGLLGNGDCILYGEWLTAKHSIPYHRLPDYFVAFDLFDKATNRFYSRERFHQALNGTGIPVVPVIYRGVFPRATATTFRQRLIQFLDTKSIFRTDNGPVEGIVLRVDRGSDNATDNWLESRYKVVRPDFVRGCQGGHWFKRKIEKQRVDYDFQAEYLEQCYCLQRPDSQEIVD